MKVGDLVVVWRDKAEALVTTVRDVGESSGVAVVWLNGVSGFYQARMVRPATFHDSAIPHLPVARAGGG